MLKTSALVGLNKEKYPQSHAVKQKIRLNSVFPHEYSQDNRRGFGKTLLSAEALCLSQIYSLLVFCQWP